MHLVTAGRLGIALALDRLAPTMAQSRRIGAERPCRDSDGITNA